MLIFHYCGARGAKAPDGSGPQTPVKKLSRWWPFGLAITAVAQLVGRICNNFEKNRALYDKSMKLGTWLVDNKTKKIRVSATPKMPSNGRHLVFPKWPPFHIFHYNLIIYLQTSRFLQLILLK